MEVLHELIKDLYFEKTNLNPRLRHTVRGIMVNDKNEVALIHIKGTDRFGYRDHYELPGGGIECSETEEKALVREMREEIGYLIADIKPIGMISNEYNLLERIDCQHYYLARLTQYVGQDLIDYEKDIFTEVVFIPVAKLVEFYENHPTEGIGKNIQKRDLIALKHCFNL